MKNGKITLILLINIGLVINLNKYNLDRLNNNNNNTINKLIGKLNLEENFNVCLTVYVIFVIITLLLVFL